MQIDTRGPALFKMANIKLHTSLAIDTTKHELVGELAGDVLKLPAQLTGVRRIELHKPLQKHVLGITPCWRIAPDENICKRSGISFHSLEFHRTPTIAAGPHKVFHRPFIDHV